MSNDALFATHAERAKRRAEVAAELRAGVPSKVIAERTGLTTVYINQIGRARGMERKVGRPRLLDRLTPEQRTEYVRTRRKVGAAVAARLMGISL